MSTGTSGQMAVLVESELLSFWLSVDRDTKKHAK